MRIFNIKIKYCAKKTFKYFNIVTIALCFIIGIILIKYKPVYKVSIAGQELGYSENKVALEEKIKEEIISNNEYNVDSIEVKENPIYELKLVNRNEETDKEELINKMEENMVVTYKYYEIALNNNVVEKIATMDEAESLIQEIKQENNEEVDLSIIEKYTEDIEEAATNNIEMAKTNVTQKIEENSKEEEKEEQQTAISNVNGIKIAVQPVTGTITSRYGVSSSIRSSDHTGLDIATSSGTPIKVVADGTVTFASYKGSYGNLVRIDHGNGVETWYAHTSKMYVSVGEKVTAGDTIAAVGSTGNSTGAHLHFEIRINGNHINPQNYLY